MSDGGGRAAPERDGGSDEGGPDEGRAAGRMGGFSPGAGPRAKARAQPTPEGRAPSEPGLKGVVTGAACEGAGAPDRIADRAVDRLGDRLGDRVAPGLLSLVRSGPLGRLPSPGPFPGPSPAPAAAPVLRADAEGLAAAALDPDRERRAEVVAGLLARGVSAAEIVERHVPAAARHLGDLWAADRLAFAEVTIATASLQGLVRALAPPPPTGGGARPAPLVALVVREGETHTLGAIVAAAQLRRRGASVMLLMGRPDAELVAAVRGGDLAMVCVSASQPGADDGLARLVGRLRAASGAPVLLGGSILDDAEPERVRAETGADHATADPDLVLRLCGLEPDEGPG